MDDDVAANASSANAPWFEGDEGTPRTTWYPLLLSVALIDDVSMTSFGGGFNCSSSSLCVGGVVGLAAADHCRRCAAETKTTLLWCVRRRLRRRRDDIASFRATDDAVNDDANDANDDAGGGGGVDIPKATRVFFVWTTQRRLLEEESKGS